MLNQSITKGRIILQIARKADCNRQILAQKLSQFVTINSSRCFSTSFIRLKRIGPMHLEDNAIPQRKSFKDNLLPDDWLKLIEKYPDFLPDPINNSPFLVMRTIDDMLKRRAVIDIPEFYVGSILAVTTSDTYSSTKKSRFVGICIHRTGQLTWSNFTLRNVIDGMGCEVRYDLYNPLIQSIEVLKLEKRLDDTLIYLRDALPEYSTVPEDMKPIVLDAGVEVPVNNLLVKMKPLPWSRKWEKYLLKGIEKMEDMPELFANRVKLLETNPVYSYDTMLEYRRHCTEETMYNICKRLWEHENTVVAARKDATSKKFIRVTRAPLGQQVTSSSST